MFTAGNIFGLSPAQRGCFFPTEGGLEFYQRYSHQNCLLECRILACQATNDCTAAPQSMSAMQSKQFSS